MTLWLEELFEKLQRIACGLTFLIALALWDLRASIAVFILVLLLILAGLSPRIFATLVNYLTGRTGQSVHKSLGPVEAAVLLRVAPGRILTMIMCETMQKGNIRLTSTEPVRLEIVSKMGLSYYEKHFVDAIVDDLPVEQKMTDCFRYLNQCVLDKTRRYSRDRTAEFYREKIAAIWDDMEAVDTPELRQQKFTDSILWLIADDDYARKVSRDLRAPGWDTFSVSVNYCWYQDRVWPSPDAEYPASNPDLQYALAKTCERAAGRSVSSADEAFAMGSVPNPFAFLDLMDTDRS